MFESTTKFLPGSMLVFGSLLFIADKLGDLNLQEPKPQAITGSGNDWFPPTPVQVGLTYQAQHKHESSKLGESESDLSRDSAGHREICCPDVVDLIYKPLSESNSDGD
jgi:hypothetical protein